MHAITRPTSIVTDRHGYACDLFVVHETAGRYPGDLNWLVAGGAPGSPVSVNWYIQRTGTLYCLDPLFRATAHAGACAWQGRGASEGAHGWGWANLASEGVELEGPNDGTPCTPAQIHTLTDLIRWRCQERGIPPDRVVRHSDIAQPQGRKSDPRGIAWESLINALWPNHLTFVAPPRCSLAVFSQYLHDHGSPAEPEAADIYHGLSTMGIDPAVALGFFVMESSCGTAGIATQTRNWGNVRTGMGRETGSQQGFAVYPSWTASALDWGTRILTRYIRQWGLHTVERAVPTYAPRSDANDPERYIARVRQVVADSGGGDPIQSLDGADGAFTCSTEVRQFYLEHGGIVTFGYPVGHEWEQPDLSNEACRWFPCENAWIKVKPSLPDPWRVRPASMAEVAALHRETV